MCELEFEEAFNSEVRSIDVFHQLRFLLTDTGSRLSYFVCYRKRDCGHPVDVSVEQIAWFDGHTIYFDRNIDLNEARIAVRRHQTGAETVKAQSFNLQDVTQSPITNNSDDAQPFGDCGHDLAQVR